MLLQVHFALPPKAQPAPASVSNYRRVPPVWLMLAHVVLYGITYLIAGLGHQYWSRNRLERSAGCWSFFIYFVASLCYVC